MKQDFDDALTISLATIPIIIFVLVLIMTLLSGCAPRPTRGVSLGADGTYKRFICIHYVEKGTVTREIAVCEEGRPQ